MTRNHRPVVGTTYKGRYVRSIRLDLGQTRVYFTFPNGTRDDLSIEAWTRMIKGLPLEHKKQLRMF